MTKTNKKEGWEDEPVPDLTYNELASLAKSQPAVQIGRLHTSNQVHREMIVTGILQCSKKYKTVTDGINHGMYVIADMEKWDAKMTKFEEWWASQVPDIDPNEKAVVHIEQFIR